MAKRPHWLDAVERVLNARTGDLRELAKIAGEDPRTFYIGTSLGGVDIRGQDLRGMLLPNLDLQQAIWDEHTKLDAVTNASPIVRPPEALAWLPLVEGDGWVDRLVRGARVRAFSAGAIRDFEQQRLNTLIPSFVVGTADKCIFLDDAISVLAMRTAEELSRESRLLTAEKLASNAVLIPTGQRAMSTVSDFLVGLVGDFIAYVAANPVKLPTLLKEHPTYIFCSPKGVGRDPHADAIVQIFDTMELSEVETVSKQSWLFAENASSGVAMRIGLLLLPTVKEIKVRVPSRWNRANRASALIAIDGTPRQASESFLNAVSDVFRENGWRLTPSNIFSGFRAQSAAEHTGYEIILQAPPLEPNSHRWARKLSDLNQIWVLPAPSDRLCAEALELGEIVTRISDCFDFHAARPGIWQLIATQALRMASSRDTEVLGRFFSTILLEADFDEVLQPPQWLRRLLPREQKRFSRPSVPALSVQVRGKTQGNLVFQLNGREPGDEFAENEILLSIERDGPKILGPSYSRRF